MVSAHEREVESIPPPCISITGVPLSPAEKYVKREPLNSKEFLVIGKAHSSSPQESSKFALFLIHAIIVIREQRGGNHEPLGETELQNI